MLLANNRRSMIRVKKLQEISESALNDESLVSDDYHNSNSPEIIEISEEPATDPLALSPVKNTRKAAKPKRGRPQKRTRKPSTRKKVISKFRLENALDIMNQTDDASNSTKKIKIENDVTNITTSPLENTSTEETEKTVYSCKFCKKDFSSAFILCLHIRIHEKVGSVAESNENSKSVDNSSDTDDVEELPMDREIEEIILSEDDDEPEEKQSVAPKSEFIGIINKNFVENLRKNLSLAMNRQIK